MLLNLGRDSALLTLGLLLVHRDLLLDLLHLRLCLLVSVLESLVLRIDHANSLQFVLHHEVLCDCLHVSSELISQKLHLVYILTLIIYFENVILVPLVKSC